LNEWLPEMILPDDGVERKCKRCGNSIERARVTAGYVGSGQRRVIGGWYGVEGDPGPYCESCALTMLEKRRVSKG